ncbi:MAG: alpha-2-macroglobulin [Thermodesulfobacteriota bacterium]
MIWSLLPKPLPPELVHFKVTPPPRTPIEDPEAKPRPMRIGFDRSVASISLIGKEASGFSVHPPIEGAWIWINDKRLEFQPRGDWPIGTQYSVEIDPKVAIAPHQKLAMTRFEFRTEPFVASVRSSEFYQDPTDPKLKKVVVEFKFSYPVDSAEFEKKLALGFVERRDGKDASAVAKKFTVSYDKLKLTAYAHSEPLVIPAEDSRMEIKLASGLRSSRGGPGASALTSSVGVPGRFSLTIRNISLTLVDNERFEPEQVAIFEASEVIPDRTWQTAVGAYLLPVYHPRSKPEDRQRPHSWDLRDVTAEILKQATPLRLEAIASEVENTKTAGFKYHADPERYVYFTVAKDIRSFGGYQLFRTHGEVQKVPQYPKTLKILGNGALLTMSGEKKLGVFARDVEAVEYEIARVAPNQLHHLLDRQGNWAKFSDVREVLGNQYQDRVSERFIDKIELEKLGSGKPQFLSIDLGKYLHGDPNNRRGLFLVQIRPWHKPPPEKKLDIYEERRTEGEGEGDATEGRGEEDDVDDGGSERRRAEDHSGPAADSRLILVTDLGVVVKRALDGTQDVFVQSIQSGDPVSGVTVEVIGINGQPVATAHTDAGGAAHLLSLQGMTREKTPAYYLVRKGGDYSFLPLGRADRGLDYSRFDVGGVANTQPERLSAYLFSDRGIYRPGEMMHFGMVVRATDWGKNLAGVPLEIDIIDARGAVVKREKLKLSSVGFESVSHKTQESSPTGTYTANLYLVRSTEQEAKSGEALPNVLLGSTVVRVQEFQPDRMKLSVRLSAEQPEGWVSPQDLKVRINLQNLFGTPAANRRVTARLSLSPVYPAFPSYRDYRFYDPQRAKNGFDEDLPEAQTDAQGNAEIDLRLNRFVSATYLVHVIAQGFEPEGGRSVAAETAQIVSSLPCLIGTKSDGDLNYISRDGKRSVQIIAINAQAKKIPVDHLKQVFFERRYVSVLTKQPSGVYKYESKPKDIRLDEKPLAITTAGATIPLGTQRPGSYFLLITDPSGVELNRVSYTVAGDANLTRSLDKNAELQIVLDKQDYTPGDQIKLNIRAPYTGAGLITIERDRVYASKWFKTRTTSSVQTMTLPAGLEGNGYVNVTFVRDPASNEIFMSPLSYGVAPFSVNVEKRRLKVDVKTPDLVKPGDPFTMRVNLDRAARLVVVAVDEGILQVARYKNPDPLGYFFQKRSMDVRTQQILDMILPEFKRFLSAAAPGGGEGGELGKHLNPFKRKRDKPVTYWSGLVDVKPGEHDFTYTVPDTFNGTLRVYTVAVSEDAIGVQSNKALVRGDFVLTPNVPLMVAPGDEFEVSVGVANNVIGSGQDVQIALRLETSPHLEVIGPAQADLRIGELREGVAAFHVRAKDRLGSGNLTFLASALGKSAKASVDTSVRPPVPLRTELTIGSIADGKADVTVTRSLYPEYRDVYASMSYMPQSLAYGINTYLGHYQYLCTEQLLSCGMPAVVFAGRDDFNIPRAKAVTSIAELMSTLRSRQQLEGGFVLWGGHHEINDFISVYAVHVMIEARERGFAVPDDMLTNATLFLRQIAAGDGRNLADERNRAYAVYILTRLGNVTTNYLTALQQRMEQRAPKTWKQDLAAAYMASSYQIMKQDKLADAMIGRLNLGLPSVEERKHLGIEYAPVGSPYYNDAVRDAQIIYLLAQHFPQRAAKLTPESLSGLVYALQKGYYHSLSSAYMLLAFDRIEKYLQGGKTATLRLLQFAADDKAETLAGPAFKIDRTEVPPTAARLQFVNEAKFPAYYVLSQTGFDLSLPTKTIASGFEIVREFVDASGKALQRVRQGDEFEVVLRVRAIDREAATNVAIVDLLPGGFEVVLQPPALQESGGGEPQTGQRYQWRSRLATHKSTWALEYNDVREDRVLLFGNLTRDVSTFVYRVKATAAGTFTVPPPFGEGMYDRTLVAQGLGTRIVVEKPEEPKR